MNPARSFAPALWHMNFANHWIYWLGPLAAAVLATFLYKYVFYREAPKPVDMDKPKSAEMTPLNA